MIKKPSCPVCGNEDLKFLTKQESKDANCVTDNSVYCSKCDGHYYLYDVEN